MCRTKTMNETGECKEIYLATCILFAKKLLLFLFVFDPLGIRITSRTKVDALQLPLSTV